MRSGCRVTLYQDAHCLPESPNIPFQSLERPDGQEHQPNTCWKDIYDSLKNANEIICITGN